MSEFISSFLENIKQKTSNTFFGTLILVWLARNWLLVYSLFNFDKECTLSEKISYIVTYLSLKGFWCEFFTNIGLALVFFIIANILIILSRSSMTFIDHTIMPYLNKKVESGLVVNKDSFEIVKKQRDEFFNKIIIQDDIIIQVEQKYSETKILYNESVKREAEIQQSLTDKTNELKALDADHERKTNSLARLESDHTALTKDFNKIDVELTETKQQLINYKEIATDFATSFRVNEQINDTITFTSVMDSELYNAYNELTTKELISPFFQLENKLYQSELKKHNFAKDYLKLLIDLKLVEVKTKIDDSDLEWDDLKGTEFITLTVLGTKLMLLKKGLENYTS